MSALRARLVGLVEAWDLPEGSARPLRALLDAVENDPTAPTTVTDPVAGVEVHVADSLDGLLVPALRDASHIVDIGAGAGFPGLVLAVALPTAQVALVESAGRKCDFMRRAAVAAGLEGVEVVHTRAEEWRAGHDLHDVVTARAVAPLGVLVEWAAPLLRVGGRLVAWKGARDPGEEADAEAAAAATGMALEDVVVIPPRPGAEHRHLHVHVKREPTPEKFPRRAGMARKRPITAP